MVDLAYYKNLASSWHLAGKGDGIILNEPLSFKRDITISATKYISGALYFSVYFRAKDKYTLSCSTGENWFALKRFLGNESTGCPLVLKQGKTYSRLLTSTWNILCYLCGLKLESSWYLSSLGRIFYSPYYFSDYGEGVNVFTVKVIACTRISCD